MCGERLKKSKLHYWILEKALEEALNSLREIKDIFSVWFCQFKQTSVSFSTLVYLPVFCLLGFRLCMCVSKSVFCFCFWFQAAWSYFWTAKALDYIWNLSGFQIQSLPIFSIFPSLNIFFFLKHAPCLPEVEVTPTECSWFGEGHG